MRQCRICKYKGSPCELFTLPVPEFINPVFAKTMKNERFGLVFAKTGSINSGTGRLGSEGVAEQFCIALALPPPGVHFHTH